MYRSYKWRSLEISDGTGELFLTRQNNGGEGARGRQVLIIKNSTHGDNPTPDYKFNHNRESLNFDELENQFMRYWMKDENEKSLSENTVYMGGSCASALILPARKNKRV